MIREEGTIRGVVDDHVREGILCYPAKVSCNI